MSRAPEQKSFARVATPVMRPEVAVQQLGATVRALLARLPQSLLVKKPT